MERRELYDPEDIEQLLMERPFDGLLEEERAYVLRHLSGRAEYEAMRALLLNMHRDDAESALPDAPPAVREHVLAAFRAQQRPQWRIWLNSVGAFMFPRDASAFWKPALALASITALIMVGIIGTRSVEDHAKAPRFAQVKEALRKNAGQRTEEPRTPSSAAPATVPVTSALAEEKPPTQTAVTEQQTTSTPTAGMPAPAAIPEKKNATSVSANEDEAGDKRPQAAPAPQQFGWTASADTAVHSDRPATREVTKSELTSNASLANATGIAARAESVKLKSAKDADETSTRSRSIKNEEKTSADPEHLLGLLRAAW